MLKMIARKHKKLLSQKDSDGNDSAVVVLVYLIVYTSYLHHLGTTPLYFAAQAGRLEALKYIHKVTNSDLSESDMGLKPIHAACQLGHTHIVKVIRSQIIYYDITDAVYNIIYIQYIVACHGSAAILQKTADDATPLHYASCKHKDMPLYIIVE